MQTYTRAGEVQAVQFVQGENAAEFRDTLRDKGFQADVLTDGPDQVVHGYVNVNPTRRADLIFRSGDWAVFDGGHLDKVPDDRFQAAHKAK